MSVDRFSNVLLDWYDAQGRKLPWRHQERHQDQPDKKPDPYAVWLCEIMAQQTTIAAVIPYWQKFLQRWPDVNALAAADQDDVLHQWAGLGYYARARNLLAAARQIAAQGHFPQTAAQWQQLPGVGPYTAAAIASIVHEEKVPVIDTNIARILSRLFTVDEPWPTSRPLLSDLLLPQIPDQRRGDFAQALMDLGASVCTARQAHCSRCPLQQFCAAHASGTPEKWPTPKPRKVRPIRYGTAWWIEYANKVAFVRRPANGLLGGLLGLPGSSWTQTPGTSLPFDSAWQLSNQSLRHVFTHFELHLDVARTCLHEPRAQLHAQPLHWLERSELLDAGLPSLYLKAVEQVLQMEPITNDQ